MLLFIEIVLIFLCFEFLIMILRQQPITRNTVLCFVGSLGSGKTYMAVKCAKKEYLTNWIKYLLSFVFFWAKGWHFHPYLYSNIPIKLFSKKYSRVLTREHLLLKETLPEKSIVVIDEIGQVASQYDFANPNVSGPLQELVRFFRHYINGRLILTDQSSDNITVAIRRRIGICYSLNDFHRYLRFLPFFKVEVTPIEFTDSQVSTVLQGQSTEQHFIGSNTLVPKPYFFGFLPYRFLHLNSYDSRCYSIRYKHLDFPGDFHQTFAKYNKEFDIDEKRSLKTDYVIDILPTDDERKAFNKKN